jgi:plastocyanin
MGIGFLGTGASFGADLNLVAQVAMGLCLLGGAFLARRGRLKAHHFCQMSVVVLNFFVILAFMLPAFRKQVAPRVPSGLRDLYHAAAFVHGMLGLAAELLAVYIVLVAGTGLVPQRLRFQNYRPWMRATLGLWWSVIALGVLTYAVWYAPSRAAAGAAPGASGAASVSVVDLHFVPAELTVAPGTLVVWTGLDGRHSVEAEDGSFKADDKSIEAGRFEHRFDRTGTYRYFCEFHGGPGAKGMSGIVRVQ